MYIIVFYQVCIKVFGNDGESKVLLMNDGISSYFDCMRRK